MYIFFILVAIVVIIAIVRVQKVDHKSMASETGSARKWRKLNIIEKKKPHVEEKDESWFYSGNVGDSDGGGFDGGGSHDGGESSTGF